MISNPKHGWCDFTLGAFKGHPSYLTDAPADLLDAFLDYHRKGMGMAWFDEEGSEFAFVITPCSLFVVEEKDEQILHDFSHIKVDDLEKELISDIESDLNGWANFTTGYTYREILKHKRNIERRVARLKKYMRYKKWKQN